MHSLTPHDTSLTIISSQPPSIDTIYCCSLPYRYCFAGVTKGSSELLAVDLSKLPVWSEETGFALSKRPYGFVNELVTCHSRSDPKLRGFGDAVRVRGDSRTQSTYVFCSLICLPSFLPSFSCFLWWCLVSLLSIYCCLRSLTRRDI
jgi:hypothetical protein